MSQPPPYHEIAYVPERFRITSWPLAYVYPGQILNNPPLRYRLSRADRYSAFWRILVQHFYADLTMCYWTDRSGDHRPERHHLLGIKRVYATPVIGANGVPAADFTFDNIWFAPHAGGHYYCQVDVRARRGPWEDVYNDPHLEWSEEWMNRPTWVQQTLFAQPRPF